MRKILSILLLCFMLVFVVLPAPSKAFYSQGASTKGEAAITVTAAVEAKMELQSPSAVLMEGSTGKILFEKNKDERLKPASITKIMTLLLIFEAMEAGKFNLTDEVTVSEYAASMGGSQVYLEPNEVQDVNTMIKCISIASANDASVAMAEFISGSEEEFVAFMNQRAKELGMNNTNFANSCGLDEDNHYSSAYDIALMSKELIRKYPEISKYATIWMDTIIHTTKKGQSEFGLTNTNKLVRFYDGITGLKTGSTGLAKYCLSASAHRNNMDLIAVIMAAPDTKTRFAEATKLLNYGFANYSIYWDDNADTILAPVRVTKGVLDEVRGEPRDKFSYLCAKGSSTDHIKKEVVLFDEVPAPVAPKDKIGEIVYYDNDEKIGSVDIIASEGVEEAKYKDYFIKVLKRYFMCYNNERKE